MIYDVRIFGMMRSGLHAIANWITATLPGLCVYYNNVTKFTADDRRYAIDTKDGAKLRNAEPRMTPECVNVVRGYEDREPAQIAPTVVENIVGAEHIYNVLILRDPFNLWASTSH